MAFTLAALLVIRIILEVHQQGDIFTDLIIKNGIDIPILDSFENADYNEPDREQTDQQGKDIEEETE
ncbi:hypothetical protein Hbl1158_12340 [Halobaculum sp. CBA1158]|uniref:hypothetical protein n=1 Tax=Halobaculum sp. CBA1158 TaxID=2904243 RepID=UPI001F3C4746|nr:hypothetical protein [Halobaculum sp. CBA1158]UIO99310.1 hypothetical protein Hbl1158_12340 [Halobaculum sp. CBA1158]